MTRWRGMRSAVVALMALVALSAPTVAVEPDEIMPDATLEARARTISAELRCLVCQNQSIDDSNAPLARDLRMLVRERLTVGDSDAAVRAFVVDRYGSFVLLRPPFRASTLLLWLTPGLILLTVIALVVRRRGRPVARSAAEAPLSVAEKAEVDKILSRALPTHHERK